jgi:O-antigen/teichoic acid export membrane protein
VSRTRRYLGGVVWTYANMAVVLVVGMWLTPFYLSHLTAERYGLWLVGAQVLAYLLLFDVGVVSIVPRETAYATGRSGGVAGRELPSIVSDALHLSVWQTPLVLLASIVVWSALPDRWAPLANPLGWVLGAFVLLFPFRVGPAVLQGLQDLGFLSRLQLTAWATTTAVSVALVVEGFGLAALAAGWIAGQIVTATLAAARLRLKFPEAVPSTFRAPGWTRAKAYLSKGGWVSVSQVAQVLLTGTDVLILGFLLGPLPVVVYACTGKLVAVLANQPQVLTQAAAPALAELRTGGTPTRLRVVSAALTQAMLFVSGLIVCAVIAATRPFVTWWVGPQQFGGMRLTMLLALVMLLRHWSTTMVYTLFAFGRERRIAITSVTDGLVTTCGALILVRLIGIHGAPLASLIGVCAVSIPLNLRALTRDLSLGVGDVFAWWPWGWRFLVAASGACLLGLGVGSASFLHAAAAASAAAALYLVLTVRPVLASPLGPYLAGIAPVWTRRFLGAAGQPAGA